MANGERRTLPHIYLEDHGEREEFTSPRSGGAGVGLPPRNRGQHARQIERALTQALAAADRQIQARDANIEGGTPGFYLEFDIPMEQRPLLDRLEDRRGRQNIDLVSVRPSGADPENLISATVFVPESKRDAYFKKVEDYRTKETRSGKPRNEPLIASINDVRLAQVQSLFTDDRNLFPAADQQAWWEVWLRHDGRPVFEHAANNVNVVVRDHIVEFAEREVVLAHGTPQDLGRIVANTDAVAELRLARDTPARFMEMAPDEQREWAEDLVDRLEPPPAGAPAVCILDSGTTRLHPLIQPALEAADQQAWDPTWTVEDVGRHWIGHGTQMSGVALYGDLTPVLTAGEAVELGHRLESVKILPDQGANDPDLYGYITATAVSRAEIQAPERRRAFCLAVTSDGDHWRGRPSSWSAKLDDLAYGDGEDQRLIVVAAGNIGAHYPANEYLAQNDTAIIENPAQSWNALTVGAITEKSTITDPDHAGWQPFAPAGDLSPLSRTSVSWHHEWPIKPDLVCEGGNYGIDPATNAGDHIDDLALLTTYNRAQERLFTVTGDTSAATALVSRMAAQILADEPDLWPETVRALIVHSAEWSEAMRGHLPVNPRQSDKRLLLRRYGYGIPNLSRAIRSLNSDVTLVVEGEIQPFFLDGSNVKTRDMVLHELPWPSEALEELGGTQVQMKVTLSYFVEPNPGERGWTQRHRYSSHGLRFAVKRAEENIDTFRRRINAAAREEEAGHHAAAGADEGWVLGPRLRDRGSLHSDIWEGTATDLANRHGIAVYPTGGWWREKPALQRSDRRVRYALTVTLRASVEIDLYTEIQNEIAVGVEVET